MPSYLVTGASRGLGYEFLRQLSEDPNSVVIGIVRNREATEKKVYAELNRSNVHILQGDLDDHKSLKNAAEAASKITGGSLDYLIANGAMISRYSEYSGVRELAQNPEEFEKDLLESFMTNVVGTIHLFDYFVPLLQKGTAKKAIALTSGLADIEPARLYDLEIGPSYSISKAALNMAVAKFSAQYRKEGILFMSISPGVVDTGNQKLADLPEEKKKGAMALAAKFVQAYPHFKGPISPEESVKSVLAVVENASVERGDGGSYVSHYGNKQWL